MRKQITIVLEQGRELVLMVPDRLAIGCDAAHAWLEQQFLALQCKPLRAGGAVLTADKILAVTRAAGQAQFDDARWCDAYVSAVSCALAKPLTRVDVPSMTITY